MTRGIWVTFEGGDGTGKTTQATRLETWLREQQRTVAVSYTHLTLPTTSRV